MPARYRGFRRPEAPAKRTHKYDAQATVVDNIKFPSKAQAKRYTELRMLQAAGLIRDLRLEIPYVIRVNEVDVCTYVADFVYEIKPLIKGSEVVGGFWATIVEDVKGFRTPVYRLKKKLVRAVHGIEIKEIG